ncbi:MAG: glutamate--tRNA ligase [Candidatus Tectomicrobia bacterium]|jgi:glutamyl-tRNA synthetase|nr:glutamate--tRNA ligase [Candidatus Tectomicrobia bacterium]
MTQTVRVRFPPSPTGHLHIGGVRTALFNWLYARHSGGVFVLRIEDTDRTRSTEESIQVILEGLSWLGLDWDEGPYRQTERLDVYQAHAYRLLAEGRAYHCYCSPQELQERREAALRRGENPRYDRRCRDLPQPPPGRQPAIRIKAPLAGQTTFVDLIHGELTFENSELDDLIILRSDGTPTYNFAVVVDDVTMRITHVIRGDDHIPNTPRQIMIYHALDYPLPQFGHVSMILGSDKGRLSKRHGATSVLAYRELGYLPEAILNYLARLGWAHGDQEIFSKEELVEQFSLSELNKAAAIFNPDKLLWLNAHYLRTLPSERLIDELLPHLTREGIVKSPDEVDRAYLARAIDSVRERSKTLVEMAKWLRFYFTDHIIYEDKAAAKFLTAATAPLLSQLVEGLERLPTFDEASIEQVFQRLMAAEGVALGALAQPARVALTGGTVSPGIHEVMAILGRERVLSRLRKALEGISGRTKPVP